MQIQLRKSRFGDVLGETRKSTAPRRENVRVPENSNVVRRGWTLGSGKKELVGQEDTKSVSEQKYAKVFVMSIDVHAATASRVGGERSWSSRSCKPFDEQHRSTTFGAKAKHHWSWRWMPLPWLVAQSRATESKVARWWHVCDWPGGRSYGCARNLWGADATGNGAELIERQGH